MLNEHKAQKFEALAQIKTAGPTSLADLEKQEAEPELTQPPQELLYWFEDLSKAFFRRNFASFQFSREGNGKNEFPTQGVSLSEQQLEQIKGLHEIGTIFIRLAETFNISVHYVDKKGSPLDENDQLQKGQVRIWQRLSTEYGISSFPNIRYITEQEKSTPQYREQELLMRAFFHDLRSPVVAMIGFTELILNQEDNGLSNKKVQEFYVRIQNSLEEFAILMRAFNLKEGKILKEKETVARLQKYFNKIRANAEQDEKILQHDEMIKAEIAKKRAERGEIVVSEDEEKKEGQEEEKHITISCELLGFEDPKEYEKSLSYFNIPALLRIYINAVQNSKRAGASELKVRLKKGATGIIITFDDNGPGFPSELPGEKNIGYTIRRFLLPNEWKVVSVSDGRTLNKYTPRKGKTWWAHAEGTGTGLAAFQEAVKEMGGVFITGTRSEGGARTEMFFPYVS